MISNFFLKKILDFFVLLIPLEKLSHYPDTDISHGSEMTFNGSWIKSSEKKLMV